MNRVSRMRPFALGVLAVALVTSTSSGCGGSSDAPSSAASATTPAPSSASTSASASGVRAKSLSLVAIGDSIPYNSPDDCPGCTGFVDRYAKAAQKAIGTPVTVTNLSQHNGLTLPGLLDELDQFRAQLSQADIIVVGIAHNTTELNSDHPCGGSLDANELPPWPKLTSQCAMASVHKYRPQYDRLYSQIARWRNGKPTVLRTIDHYNDFTGDPGLPISPADNLKIKLMLDTWNTMLCSSARANGFVCADIYHAFNGANGLTPSADLVGPDYTHPSDKGNAVIANVLIGEGFAPLA